MLGIYREDEPTPTDEPTGGEPTPSTDTPDED